jgi:hypothetical protein
MGWTQFVAGLRSSAFLTPLLLSTLSCCTHDGIVAFNVTPPLVCATKTVAITWNVRGRAQLNADPPPPNWNPQVASQGSLPAVPVAKDTTFTLVALDADPARGAANAQQPAQVTDQDDPRAAQASCDTAGNCSGDITINADPSVRVKKLSGPTWRVGFKVAPHEVCVTPPGGQPSCVPENGSLDLNAPANGKWLFSAKLPAGYGDPPPSQLRAVFDFGCQ